MPITFGAPGLLPPTFFAASKWLSEWNANFQNPDQNLDQNCLLGDLNEQEQKFFENNKELHRSFLLYRAQPTSKTFREKLYSNIYGALIKINDDAPDHTSSLGILKQIYFAYKMSATLPSDHRATTASDSILLEKTKRLSDEYHSKKSGFNLSKKTLEHKIKVSNALESFLDPQHLDHKNEKKLAEIIKANPEWNVGIFSRLASLMNVVKIIHPGISQELMRLDFIEKLDSLASDYESISQQVSSLYDQMFFRTKSILFDKMRAYLLGQNGTTVDETQKLADAIAKYNYYHAQYDSSDHVIQCFEEMQAFCPEVKKKWEERKPYYELRNIELELGALIEKDYKKRKESDAIGKIKQSVAEQMMRVCSSYPRVSNDSISHLIEKIKTHPDSLKGNPSRLTKQLMRMMQHPFLQGLKKSFEENGFVVDLARGALIAPRITQPRIVMGQVVSEKTEPDLIIPVEKIKCPIQALKTDVESALSELKKSFSSCGLFERDAHNEKKAVLNAILTFLDSDKKLIDCDAFMKALEENRGYSSAFDPTKRSIALDLVKRLIDHFFELKKAMENRRETENQINQIEQICPISRNSSSFYARRREVTESVPNPTLQSRVQQNNALPEEAVVIGVVVHPPELIDDDYYPQRESCCM